MPGACVSAPPSEWRPNLRSNARESFILVDADFPRVPLVSHRSSSIADDKGLFDCDPWEGCEELADESLIEWLMDVLCTLPDGSSVEKQLLMDRSVLRQLIHGDWNSSCSVDSQFLGRWCWHVIGQQGNSVPKASASLLAEAAADPDDRHLSAWPKGIMNGVTLAEAGNSPSPEKRIGKPSSDGRGLHTGRDDARMSVSSRASTATPTVDGRLSEVSFDTPRGGDWDYDICRSSEVMRPDLGKSASLLLPSATPRSTSERVQSSKIVQGQRGKSVPRLGLPSESLSARTKGPATARRACCALPLSSLTRVSANKGSLTARNINQGFDDAAELCTAARDHGY